MNLRIELEEQTELKLRAAASQRGMPPESYPKQLIEDNLPRSNQPALNQATLDLLATWEAEDQTGDPQVLATRERELNEFKAAMNQNRHESGGGFAREIYP